MKTSSPRRIPDVVRLNIDSIAAGYSPQRIIMHGSFARGDQHEGSDLDLIIIKNTTEKFADRIEHVLEFVPGGIAVEPMVYTEEELAGMLSEGNSFLEKALAEGVTVYEQ